MGTPTPGKSTSGPVAVPGAVPPEPATAASSDTGDFVVTGHPGARFTIRGNGFTGSGTVLLSGKQLPTLSWGNEIIEGLLPADAKSGEVVVWIDQATQKRGRLEI